MQRNFLNISDLRTRLQSIAFLMTQNNKSKEAHAEIIRVISDLSELETDKLQAVEEGGLSKIEVEEVKKVTRRLKLWAKRPSQINSHILTAFLTLERDGVKKITEEEVKKLLPDPAPFESNFAQMKIIAEKNHGKVFEQYGEEITLWPPIEKKVREYESYVFN